MTGPGGDAAGDPADRIARGYRHFADVDAAPTSPLYAQLARAVADDPELLAFVAALPPGKRHPTLLLAAVQFLHGTPEDAGRFRDRVLGDPDRVRTTMLQRATQTNEPARCAALLPLLARLPGPLALLEVGASAGLCLYPDRYAYSYDGAALGGPSTVRLTCATSGTGPVPDRLPEVRARIGVDLQPLDAADPADLAWLRACIWPGPAAQPRLDRLTAAARIAAAEPPQLLAGDLVERLPDALALVPAGATAVVLHTAVLMYLPRERREAFAERVRSAGVRWIAQEDPAHVPGAEAHLPPGTDTAGRFALCLDGRPLALTAPHGGRIDWLPAAAELR
jgi:hypothetical protein